MVPQIVFFAVVAAVGWYGYKSFKREADRVHEKVRRAEKEGQTGAIGTLVRDEKTGEYVVKDD